MMTSFAFILGLLPLVVAVGPSQLARRNVGTPVFGGMLTASFNRHLCDTGALRDLSVDSRKAARVGPTYCLADRGGARAGRSSSLGKKKCPREAPRAQPSERERFQENRPEVGAYAATFYTAAGKVDPPSGALALLRPAADGDVALPRPAALMVR
jgi:hypothetical protein